MTFIRLVAYARDNAMLHDGDTSATITREFNAESIADAMDEGGGTVIGVLMKLEEAKKRKGKHRESVTQSG